MIYTINLFLSLLICFYNDLNKSRYSYSVSIGFCIFLWTCLIGGQYNVGTDYESYYWIFTNTDALELYYRKGEYLFYYIVYSLNYIGISGQQIFIVIAFFYSVMLFKVLSYIDKRNTLLFILLYITVSTVFHNQMNGIRQYMAVYLITLQMIFLLKKNYLISTLLLFASYFIHNSCLLFVFLIPVMLLMIYKVRSPKLIILILLVSSLVSLFSFEDKIKDLIYLSPEYRHYVESDYLSDMSLKGKITKLIFVPIYVYAILTVYKSNQLNEYESKLFLLGIYSFIFRTLFLVTSVTNRLGYYFLILSIFPLFFLLRYLKVEQRKRIFIIISYFFILQYLVKVLLFPVGEYSYDSYYIECLR